MSNSTPNSLKIKPLKGGRAKGQKNRRTIAREQADLAAKAGVLATGKLPAAERKGIDPLALLLDSMRAAWEQGHKLGWEAQDLARKAKAMPQGPEQSAMMEEATTKLMASRSYIQDARALAVQAAPYKHPKLTNTVAKVSGDLTVEVKQF